MLFKSELPPPRYAPDIDVRDEEIGSKVSYKLNGNVECEKLVLVAPRLTAAVTEWFGLQKVSKLELVAVQQLKQPANQQSFDLEFNFQPEPKTEVTTFDLFSGPEKTVFVALPPLTSDDADAFVGQALIELAKPSKVVVAAPGMTFMRDEVVLLKTGLDETKCTAKLAEPPTSVLGACASAFSQAVRQQISAEALILKSEGAVNHEMFSFDALNEFRDQLVKLLGLKLLRPEELGAKFSDLYV